MPFLRCPSCREWSERILWRAARGESRPAFAILCPGCGRGADVSEPEYRLRLPAHAREEALLIRIAFWLLGGRAPASPAT